MKYSQNLIRVYLVEDYKLIRIGIKSTFRKNETVELVGEAQEANFAIKEIQKVKPDVVLMDIGLPGMNGLEAARKIKEFLPEIKIVILTSHDSETEVLAALSSGISGYCRKTISSEELINAIKAVNSGAIWLDFNVAQAVFKYLPKFDCVNNLEELKFFDNKYMLSPKELDVLKFVVMGKSNEEISKEMFISVHTTKIHIGNILRKLSVCGRTQAAVKALKEKIVS